MPRHTSRKTSASIRIADQKRKRSESQQNRRTLKHDISFQQPYRTNDHPEPGPSSAHQHIITQPASEVTTIHNYQNPRSLIKIACQPLSLHFSEVYHLNPFSAQCPHCSAQHWNEERTKSSMKNPIFSTCCANGKVILPTPANPPVELKKHMVDQSQCK